MSANFTPTLGEYSGVRPFRFWCQKVLPLVYDDSLSYYEMLCKVKDYLNKLIEDVATAEDNIEELLSAYQQLENYVNTYFDNLDVQEEINEKLDTMASDGTLGNLVGAKIDELAGDGTISTMVNDKVDDLVEDGVINGMVDDKLETMAIDGTIGAIIDRLIVDTLNPVVVSTTANMTDVNTTYILASNAHVYQYNGSEFADTGIVFGSSIGNVLTYYGISTSALSTYADNSMYLVASPTPTDAPNSLIGMCITIGQPTFKIQLYYTLATGQMFFRSYRSGSWNAWTARDNSAFEYGGTLNSGYDLNNAEPMYCYIVPNGGSLVNKPDAVTDGAGMMYSYGLLNGARVQYYVVFSTGAEFYRAFGGSTWSSWIELNSRAELFKYSGNRLTDCNDADGMSLYIIEDASNTGNCPVASGAGYLFTYGLTGLARIQFYKNFSGTDLYYRRSSGSTYLDWETMLSDGTVGNDTSKMYSIGNSILTGSVWTNGSYDHLCPYPSAPYAVIADAIHILKSNVTHRLISSTGLLYDAGEGNFLTNIKTVDTSQYDVVLTHLWTRDMEYPLGSASSVANDGSIAGAVKELVNYIKTNNGNTQFILVGVPPVSTTISGTSVFSGAYSNGKSLAECEALMSELADDLHFTFIGWQELNLSYYYQDFTDGVNVHANNETTYRIMGSYLGGRASRNINF